MVFRINGEKAEVTLENERTAEDLVCAVAGQLEEGMVIASVEIDGRYYSQDTPELAEIGVENINDINLEIFTKEELAVSLLQEVKGTVARICTDIKENAFSHTGEINSIIDWIIETIRAVNNASFFELAESKLLIATMNQVRQYINSGEREEAKIDSLVNILESLGVYLSSMQDKIVSNYAISKEDLTEAINTGIELLPEISENFQTGNDQEALAKIHLIINLLEMCSVYFKQNMTKLPEQSREDAEVIYNDMNGLLSEIVEAFENADFVLIGDLLEYEFGEKLENYKSKVLI
jgi:hypothetical protein